MKNMIVTIALSLVSIAAVAAPGKLASQALHPVEGKVVSVATPMPNCPPNAMCEVVSVLTVKFNLGCIDELAPITYTTSHAEDGKLNVLISALATNKSQNIKCLVANVKTAQIVLGLGIYHEDDINVEFLQATVLAK